MISIPEKDGAEGKATPQAKKEAGLLVLDVGNSCTHLGLWSDEGLSGVCRIEHDDWPGLDQAVRRLLAEAGEIKVIAAVIASVVPDLTHPIEEAVERTSELNALVIGRDVPLPLEVAVNRPETLGVDRVCAAAAAYQRVGGACTIVDLGSAVTVDFVDETGVFQGGAIFPGLKMQAQALGESTAALPTVSMHMPDNSMGKDTEEAIRSGICYGVAGAIRGLVEQFATELNQWPYVVATGGDWSLLAGQCDFIDAQQADLCLHGVGLAYLKHLNAQEDDGE